MCGSDKTCGCGCEAKPSRASARRARRDVVLTDREGRAFDRPRRSDFKNEGAYLDAYDDYRRRVSDAMSNRGMQLSLERDSDGRAKRSSPRPYVDTFTVSAEYPGGPNLRHDAALQRAAGKEANGSGTAAFGRQMHDIDWAATSLRSAEAMAARLYRVRVPGLRVSVDPPLNTTARRDRDRDLYAEARAHGAVLDRAATSRDPRSEPPPLVVGALYYLEWDAHDEGDEGTYVYNGVYSQTGAGMFRRVSRFPNQRVTLYLFPHEVRYLELLARPHAAEPRGVPTPPSSAPRSRRAPELHPGRALLRLKRNRVWDEGIAGERVVRAARFEGFRRIDGEMFGVWSVNDVLYAQPRRP